MAAALPGLQETLLFTEVVVAGVLAVQVSLLQTPTHLVLVVQV
jgi:hypothetical protein